MTDEERRMDFETIARIAHEANRALCHSQGDYSQPPWDEAPRWLKQSVMYGVRLHAHSDASAEESHAAWVRYKEQEGWVYGARKSIDAKTHPNMVPYSELPDAQKAKDHLFRGIVRALRDFTTL